MKKLIKIILLILSFLLIIEGLIYLHGEWHFRKGLVFQNEDNLNLALKEYKKATFSNPNPK